MSQEPIRVVEYDPEWPERYAREEARLRAAVGEHVEAIEHIGSTAVPGLPAKPIIDVMVGTATLAEAEACIEPIEALGYEYVPELEESMPERRYFRKIASGRHTHHLHVVETGSAFFERHLLFRDYLRDHPEIARRYGGLKRDLAQEHRHDVGTYTEAKAEFIREVEERARAYYDGRG